MIHHKYLTSPNDANNTAVTEPSNTWSEVTELQSVQRTTEWRSDQVPDGCHKQREMPAMCLKK